MPHTSISASWRSVTYPDLEAAKSKKEKRLVWDPGFTFRYFTTIHNGNLHHCTFQTINVLPALRLHRKDSEPGLVEWSFPIWRIRPDQTDPSVSEEYWRGHRPALLQSWTWSCEIASFSQSPTWYDMQEECPRRWNCLGWEVGWRCCQICFAFSSSALSRMARKHSWCEISFLRSYAPTGASLRKRPAQCLSGLALSRLASF